MKVIELTQGSTAWHEWRLKGIGASEAPMVTGISTYKSAHRLWQEKLGIVVDDPEKMKFVFEKGHKIEAQARAYFELMNDKDCPPICLEMDEYPFIRASLDGYNAQENFALEIKYVGKDAMLDEIPAHHFAQLQHQMMVCGANDILYIRSNDGVKFKQDVVKRDEAYIQALLQLEVKFWKMVTDKKEPPLPKPKVKKVRKNKGE